MPFCWKPAGVASARQSSVTVQSDSQSAAFQVIAVEVFDRLLSGVICFKAHCAIPLQAKAASSSGQKPSPPISSCSWQSQMWVSQLSPRSANVLHLQKKASQTDKYMCFPRLPCAGEQVNQEHAWEMGRDYQREWSISHLIQQWQLCQATDIRIFVRTWLYVPAVLTDMLQPFA